MLPPFAPVLIMVDVVPVIVCQMLNVHCATISACVKAAESHSVMQSHAMSQDIKQCQIMSHSVPQFHTMSNNVTGCQILPVYTV